MTPIGTGHAGAAPRRDLGRAAALALITACGLLTAAILPAFVTGLELALGFSKMQAATVGSANIYGAALGSVLIAVLGLRWPMRRTAAIALMTMIAIDLTSTAVRCFELLTAIRTAHGIAGGVLMGVGYSAIARTAVPDRGYGLLMILQFALGGLGIALLPGLLPAFGTAALFGPMAATASLAFAVLRALGDVGEAPSTPTTVSGRTWADRPGVTLAFAALLLFQASHTALAAFVLDLGRDAGLAPRLVSVATGLGSATGIVGALAVVWLGLRKGRLKALGVGLSVAAASSLFFLLAASPAWFISGVILASMSWTFAVPYLLGLCATFTQKSSPLWTSCASKLGLASGPMLGAVAMRGGYPMLIGTICIATCLAALAMITPARLSDRRIWTLAVRH